MKKWFSQLLGTKGAEKKAWKDRITTLSPRDVFYMPEYLMAFERCPASETRTNFGGKAHLFVYGDEDNFMVHPFFKRDLQDLPFYASVPPAQKPAYDIASPYGYAGPAARVTHHNIERALWKGFLNEFHKFCAENNIVSEFVRLNPLLKNHEQLSSIAGGVKESGTVVYVDLTAGEDALWKNLEKPNRNCITRARRENVEISRTNKKDDLEAFYKIYNESMDRRNAKKMYYFPREFYDLLFDSLKENISLFVAKHEGEVISASLFIGEENFIHYFLSGTCPETRSLGSNNLLLYGAMLWAKGQGYKTFNLGGGYQAGDSLFRFKSTFSKTTATFYTYRKVHDESKYHALCAARDNYDKSIGESLIESDYFPRYRR
jgi:serine/alanine adding enzyme